MAEEELIDFGFSAVTADEYALDQTDGENTGLGGAASPEALASMDSKIDQIMAHLAAHAKEKEEAEAAGMFKIQIWKSKIKELNIKNNL